MERACPVARGVQRCEGTRGRASLRLLVGPEEHWAGAVP